VFWSCYDYTWSSSTSDLDNVCSATFLGNLSDSAMISAVRHSFLNCGIDHDPNHLTGRISDKKPPKRLFTSISGLSAEQCPILCSVALGTSHRTSLRSEKVAG